MMSSVSWQQYLLFLLVITIIYYLCVWIIFFKGVFPSIGRISELFKSSRQAEDGPDETSSTAQHVIDELRPLFLKGYQREELFFALSSALKKYNEWDESGFRAMVNEFIINECETKCSIRPGEEELRRVWFG